MNRNKIYFINLVAALFILLFTYTALSKFLDFRNFQYTLGKSPLVGRYHTMIAWALPVGELITSVLLFMPRTKLAGLHVSLLLMSVFTLYIAYMLAFAPHLPCSCGGVIRWMNWKQHLVFNLFFTGLAGAGIYIHKNDSERQPNFLLQ
jgi:hypothetical protein